MKFLLKRSNYEGEKKWVYRVITLFIILDKSDFVKKTLHLLHADFGIAIF
jgi:hypothetical protein